MTTYVLVDFFLFLTDQGSHEYVQVLALCGLQPPVPWTRPYVPRTAVRQ